MSAHSHINMPIGAAQALLVRRSARLLKRALAQTDERSKLEGEVIGGIDVIKCSAWEVPHSRHPRQTFKNYRSRGAGWRAKSLAALTSSSAPPGR